MLSDEKIEDMLAMAERCLQLAERESKGYGLTPPMWAYALIRRLARHSFENREAQIDKMVGVLSEMIADELFILAITKEAD